MKDRTVVLNGELKRETGIAGSGYSAVVVFVPDNQSKQFGNTTLTSRHPVILKTEIYIYIYISFVFR